MTLFDEFFDDAALFPPGNSPMPLAVAAHRGHRIAWYSPVVGPFVCPAARLDELVAELHGQPLRVSLITTTSVPVDRLVELASVEGVAEPEVLASFGVPAYVELPAGADVETGLDAVAVAGCRAKLRTGGTTAEAFPVERDVARFLASCVERKVSFKCTAGLHHAVRHTDPATGFEHHGFLNVLLATQAASDGASVDDVAAVLAERDATALVGRELDPGVRTWFTSFGTCSVAEPLDDLVSLGLL